MNCEIWKITDYTFIFYIHCVHACAWALVMCKWACLRTAEGSLQEWFLSFHNVGSRDRTRIARFGNKCSLPWSHWAGWVLPAWNKVESFWKRDLQVRKCPPHWSVVLINDRWGRVCPIVGSVTPCQVVLEATIKWTKQVVENKPGSQFLLLSSGSNFCQWRCVRICWQI